MGRKYVFIFLWSFLIFFVGCEEAIEEQPLPEEEENIETIETEDTTKIEITEYGKEVGLSIEPPSKQVVTSFSLIGTVEQTEELLEEDLWVIIRKLTETEEVENQQIEYYIPLEHDTFSEDLNLPNGAGQYEVTLRLPSKDEENYYYDAATFQIINTDDQIVRDIELTKYGLEQALEFSNSISGFNEASEVFQIEGIIKEQYDAPSLLVEVKKEDQINQIVLPVKEGHFNGNIPLYFGEGTHEIRIHLYAKDANDEEGTYYHSATLYVNNLSAKTFPDFTQYRPYIESGLILEQPNWHIDQEINDVKYPIKGSINPKAPLAEHVSHVIVGIQHLENKEDQATYYFPVVDHQFEGVAYLRFGPGEYKVTIYVPEAEQKVKNEFHFTAALELVHNVRDIKDERDLLPSRGVESDHPRIIEKAKEIVQGLETEREQAKAIYQYVATHIAYDVDKYKEDIFHPDDSAIATLNKGTGICQDYTFLTIALLRSIDIEARYVSGHAGGRHAWVEAKVDGEWIEMDPTWGAGYVQQDEFHFQYNENYFDPDPKFLEETHQRIELLY